MNEVICTAEDNEIKIIYQDTDSIHLEDSDIKKLSEIYKNKYQRDLIGKYLGQFHSDFDVKGLSNIVSKKNISLGKKSYIDVLEGTDKDGNKKEAYHIRLKGIPNDVVLNYCENHEINPYELYEQLFDGKKIIFDLLDSDKPKFKIHRDGVIESVLKFE